MSTPDLVRELRTALYGRGVDAECDDVDVASILRSIMPVITEALCATESRAVAATLEQAAQKCEDSAKAHRLAHVWTVGPAQDWHGYAATQADGDAAAIRALNVNPHYSERKNEK